MVNFLTNLSGTFVNLQPHDPADISQAECLDSRCGRVFFSPSFFFFHFRSFQTSKCLSDWDDPFPSNSHRDSAVWKQEKLFFNYIWQILPKSKFCMSGLFVFSTQTFFQILPKLELMWVCLHCKLDLLLLYLFFLFFSCFGMHFNICLSF